MLGAAAGARLLATARLLAAQREQVRPSLLLPGPWRCPVPRDWTGNPQSAVWVPVLRGSTALRSIRMRRGSCALRDRGSVQGIREPFGRPPRGPRTNGTHARRLLSQVFADARRHVASVRRRGRRVSIVRGCEGRVSIVRGSSIGASHAFADVGRRGLPARHLAVAARGAKTAVPAPFHFAEMRSLAAREVGLCMSRMADGCLLVCDAGDQCSKKQGHERN